MESQKKRGKEVGWLMRGAMIGGRLIGQRMRKGEKGTSIPLPAYFSTMASTGHTSEQLPHSVHFSSLMT